MNKLHVGGKPLKSLHSQFKDLFMKKNNLIEKVEKAEVKVEPKIEVKEESKVEPEQKGIDILVIELPKLDTNELKKLTIKQLKEKCKEKGIKVSSKDKEKDLIAKLVA